MFTPLETIKHLPKSFNTFKQIKFSHDDIAEFLNPFLLCPSFHLLSSIIKAEITAWENFAKIPSLIHDRQTYFLKQRDQKSTAREPGIKCKSFLPFSYMCRLLYLLTHTPPTHKLLEASVDFGELFELCRALPHFSRNLVHEIISFCNLGSEPYLFARNAQKRLANTSWTTYKSALKQLAKHLHISLETMNINLLQMPSPISDETIYNFLMNKIDSKYWCSGRSVAVLSGLKAITRVNQSQRFDTKLWELCMSELKCSGVKTRSKQTGLLAEKNFPPEFAMQIYLQASLYGTLFEAATCQFLPLTGQRVIDYNNLLPSQGLLNLIDKYFRALWSWGKTRSDEGNEQFTYIPFGKTGSFYDIKTCWETLLKYHPPNNTYLFNFKDKYNNRVTALAIMKKYAQMVPIHLQTSPAQDLSLYFYKNMLTDFLSRTNDLHPQIGGHYLKHAVSSPAFIAQTKERFGQKAFMWFSTITMRYTLKISHLPKILKEFQRIWDEIYFEQTQLLNQMYDRLGMTLSFEESLTALSASPSELTTTT